MKNYDVVIIGGGPAGMSAGLGAIKEGVSVLIIERDKRLGGILQQCIHNGFGLHYFKEELTGTEYGERFENMVNDSNIDVMLNSFVTEISNDKVLTVISAEEGLQIIQARAVIFAMGCRERPAGAIAISGDRPAGIYTAGMAQKICNTEGKLIGKKIVILGSGDVGLITARRMCYEGAEVVAVCELMPYSSGLQRNIAQCLDDNNIPLYLSTTITDIVGKKRVEGVVIADVDQKLQPIESTKRLIECDCVLLSVGLIPENDLIRDNGINFSPITQGAIVDQNRMTNIDGFFACGNVLHVHDLVDNVSIEGEIAGHRVGEYVKKLLNNISVSDEGIRQFDSVCENKPIDYQCGNNEKTNEEIKDVKYEIKAGSGIRYVLPQVYKKESQGKLNLYFRVNNIYKNAQVIVECLGKELINKRKVVFTPGEMENIELDCQMINGDITVEIK